jgi:hypothetical protein
MGRFMPRSAKIMPKTLARFSAALTYYDSYLSLGTSLSLFSPMAGVVIFYRRHGGGISFC